MAAHYARPRAADLPPRRLTFLSDQHQTPSLFDPVRPSTQGPPLSLPTHLASYGHPSVPRAADLPPPRSRPISSSRTPLPIELPAPSICLSLAQELTLGSGNGDSSSPHTSIHHSCTNVRDPLRPRHDPSAAGASSTPFFGHCCWTRLATSSSSLGHSDPDPHNPPVAASRLNRLSYSTANLTSPNRIRPVPNQIRPAMTRFNQIRPVRSNPTRQDHNQVSPIVKGDF